MKRFNILTAVLMVCIINTFVRGQEDNFSKIGLFGENFEEIKKADKNSRIYETINGKDTIATQLVGTITDVCQAKGCWMKVDLSNNKEVFVKFKDYGFFVPLNASGSKVVMNGIAFVEEVSVKEQQHYAIDKGASKEEISKITAPKKTFRFEADGVLIKQ